MRVGRGATSMCDRRLLLLSTGFHNISSMQGVSVPQQSSVSVRAGMRGARRRSATGLLALHILAAIAVPAWHAQGQAVFGHVGSHVETQDAPCPAHADLDCLVCRHMAAGAPLATGFVPFTVRAGHTTPAPARPDSFAPSAVHSSLGARAPPLR
jgi:hypothetical protein